MIGKIPMVLKIAIQINQARWLFRADFHNAINFHTISQTARIIKIGIKEEFGSIKHIIVFFLFVFFLSQI